jgi:uncharacterized protein YfaA (DUF2138 family)
MRRTWLVAGVVAVAAVASAAVYQHGLHWKAYMYPDTRLMADLGHPDALIRTASLSRLPRDLLKVPIAKDVLTEDLVFYYDQHEDRLGLKGAIRRIAYERNLDWTDRMLVTALDEPAEMAFWRDGKGALRHFAIVMRRSALAKVVQEAASVALKDRQLTDAGEIDTGGGRKARVLALEINPRRTLLLIASGERIVVLSDPGLLFDKGNSVVPASRTAIAAWLDAEGTLARSFALDEALPTPGNAPAARPTHTLVVGAPALTVGYGAFLSGFKGLRFDFGESWSTSVWIDRKGLPSTGLGDAALWRAAPANPSACRVLPLNWQAARQVIADADKKPALPAATSLAALEGSGLVCWYRDSTLYSPVFIARLAKGLPDRNAALQALAAWAIARPRAEGGTTDSAAKAAPVAAKKSDAKPPAKANDDVMIWRAAKIESSPVRGQPTVAARGAYVVFSPDGALVDLVLDTLARRNPSVADQMPASNATLALITPRPLAAMTEQEALTALNGPGDANLRAAAQTHLPARMKALAAYPPYRLEMTGNTQSGWQRVEWRTPEERP